MARYHVRHDTHYGYELPVMLSQQIMHLTPRSCPWQQVEGHRVEVVPRPADWHEGADYFGNRVIQFSLNGPHDGLVVRAESEVSVAPHRPDPGTLRSPAWDTVAARMRQPGSDVAAVEASQFVFDSPYVHSLPALAALTDAVFSPGRPLLEAVLELMRNIHDEFSFDPTATDVATPVETVLKNRRGVCQDFAHLQIACLRQLGLAARYVSGYLLTHPPPGRPRLVGADASHAWLSVFCPGVGWIDADPTNNLLPDTEHITLAWGRDFGDVSPLRGVILGGGDHSVEVRVTVTPEDGDEANLKRA